MAIKNFLIPNSYSRIERFSISKEPGISNAHFVLTVYKDSSLKEIISQITFGINNKLEVELCSICNGSGFLSQNDVVQKCIKCSGSGTIHSTQNDFDVFVLPSLQGEMNILQVLYLYLKTKEEFKECEDC